YGQLISPIDYLTNISDLIFVADDVSEVEFYYHDGQDYVKVGDMSKDPIYAKLFNITWIDASGDTEASSGDVIRIMFNITNVLGYNGEYEYYIIADFDSPTPTITVGGGTENYEDGMIADPSTPISFNSNEIKTFGSRHYSWEDYFNLFDSSYMSHNYYPDDYSSAWTMNPLNMFNIFPTSTTTELWDNWSPPNYDPTQNTVSFNNGDFNSQVIPTIDIPEQPIDFDLTEGTSDWAGNLGTSSGYNFIITSSIKPENTHLWWEIDNSGVIYAVDSTDNRNLYKTTDKGNSWSLVASRIKDIKSGSYDVDDGLIYFGDCDGSQFTAWYLDIASDSITEVGSNSGTNLELNSVWEVAGDIYATVMVDSIVYTYLWSGSSWTVDNTEPGYNMGIMTMAYWGSFYGLGSDNLLPTWTVRDPIFSNVYIYFYSTEYSSFVIAHNLLGTGEMDIPSDKNRSKLIPFGGRDYVFILQNTTDQKYYYYISKLQGEDLSRYEMNISLIQNGPTTGKAFHVSEYEVYSTDSEGELILQDTPNLDAPIIAMTENYIMTSNGKLYEYVESYTTFDSSAVYNLIGTSAIKPENTHLWWETDNLGTIYAVDSTDNRNLYKTTNKGSTWNLITTRTKNIARAYPDLTNGVIYFIDCEYDES
ncbi:hypothetical protein LCGC14_2160750, partial [marine sediment metagenome]